MKELSPISYSDSQNSICLECFADTLVYHKADSKTRNLVAMRIGGDGEIVRGVVNAIRNKVGFVRQSWMIKKSLLLQPKANLSEV